MTIIDWNDKETMSEVNTIRKTMNASEVNLYARDGKLEDIIFRNFPKICVKEKLLKNCMFERCGILSIESCELRGCTFFSTDTIKFDDSLAAGSIFQNLCSCYGAPIILNNSTLTGCVFADVTLANRSFLCIGHADSHVELSNFHKIITDRDDRALFFYETLGNREFKKRKDFCFVDENSCNGFEEITEQHINCYGKALPLSRIICPVPYLQPAFPNTPKSPCIKKRELK